MEDLSLHILDIAENSIRAAAQRIEIVLVRDAENDLFRVDVIDNGRGMGQDILAKVRDPFFTTKGKKTGLGVPLLAQAAEQAGGALAVQSAPGKGTKVTVTFRWSNVDRPAIGNMAETLMTLIAGHPECDFVYEERDGDRVFRFDTEELKRELDGVPINTPMVLDAIQGMLDDHIRFER